MIGLDRESLDGVLPATAGSADWGDVLTRFRARRSRRRRRLVVLAAAALVAVAGTASAIGSVRAFFLDRGFVGLPPVEATPSSPESGELVVHFFGRSSALEGRLNRVWVYADGRMVWHREGAVAEGANEAASGFLEQRLTAEGVERLRSEMLATGLFDHDRELLSVANPFWVMSTAEVRNADRLVSVKWQNPRAVGSFGLFNQGTTATAEQVRELERVDALLADPASRLPANAWEDPRIKAYVASRYEICWEWRPNLDPGAGKIDASRILGLLPPPLADMLRARWRPYVWPRWWSPACTVVPTEEARSVARALDDAGLERRGGGKGRGAESLYRLAYGIAPPNVWPGSIFFEPVLPHGESACTPCG